MEKRVWVGDNGNVRISCVGVDGIGSNLPLT